MTKLHSFSGQVSAWLFLLYLKILKNKFLKHLKEINFKLFSFKRFKKKIGVNSYTNFKIRPYWI